MAGLAESVLGVRGPESLIQAVRSVWASIASGRALSYLATHGVRDVGMGVVLQPMVRAVAAGVMFTRAGKTGSGPRIINAGVGLGSPVVDGIATPDMLRITADGRVLDETIARKTKATVVGAESLEEISVATPDAPALKKRHIDALAAIANELERLENVPWDVEFACDDERVWIVQARHVTGLGFPDGGNANTVWSSVNVGEALPGSRPPSPGRSQGPSARRGSGARSRRWAAGCPSTRASSAMCTGASTST
jgi:pyruvate,water dikinase